jgi:hypothetical protein
VAGVPRSTTMPGWALSRRITVSEAPGYGIGGELATLPQRGSRGGAEDFLHRFSALAARDIAVNRSGRRRMCLGAPCRAS